MVLGTVLHVLSGIPTLVEGIKDAVSSIKGAIYTVNVVKPDEQKVISDLKTLGIDDFQERFATLKVSGIEPENMTAFLDWMAVKFKGLTYELRSRMDGYIFGTKSEYSVFEIKFLNESTKTATYMMIVIEKVNGMYDCKYVSCTMEFKISRQQADEIQKQILCGIFTETVEPGHGETELGNRVNADVIEELENFIRYLVIKKWEEL